MEIVTQQKIGFCITSLNEFPNICQANDIAYIRRVFARNG
jgi:hypothetical protein